jgi:hypothetical protein
MSVVPLKHIVLVSAPIQTPVPNQMLHAVKETPQTPLMTDFTPKTVPIDTVNSAPAERFNICRQILHFARGQASHQYRVLRPR